jgi:hypothetical protein
MLISSEIAFTAADFLIFKNEKHTYYKAKSGAKTLHILPCTTDLNYADLETKLIGAHETSVGS